MEKIIYLYDMKERNEFLEMDGLYWESDTHEWFHDKIGTNYAQSDNGLHKDALPNIVCFVTRNKETGEYDRVVMDKQTNEIILFMVLNAKTLKKSFR